MAFILAVYVRRDSPFLKWRVSTPIIKTGTHSLQVFSLVVVLGNVVNLIVLTGNPPPHHRLIMDSIAFLIMALTGIALNPIREVLVRARKVMPGQGI